MVSLTSGPGDFVFARFPVTLDGWSGTDMPCNIFSTTVLSSVLVRGRNSPPSSNKSSSLQREKKKPGSEVKKFL